MKRLLHSAWPPCWRARRGACATSAACRPPPPPPAGCRADEDEDESTTTSSSLADPGDQVRIDRRTYTLRDDPAAQSDQHVRRAGQASRRSASRRPATVTLLGADNVTIQINGQPVPGTNLEQVLRGITGAEVERIEVITNPSRAIFRRSVGRHHQHHHAPALQRRPQRLRAGRRTTTLGGYHVGISPNWSRGPWSLQRRHRRVGGGQQNRTSSASARSSAPATRRSKKATQDIEFGGCYLGRAHARLSADRTPPHAASRSIDVSGGNDILRDTATTRHRRARFGRRSNAQRTSSSTTTSSSSTSSRTARGRARCSSSTRCCKARRRVRTDIRRSTPIVGAAEPSLRDAHTSGH